jgi:hypothetical protein
MNDKTILLKMIEYTHFKTLSVFLFIMIYLSVIMSLVIPFTQWPVVFQILLIVNILTFLLLRFSTIIYKVVGTIEIGKESITISTKENEIFKLNGNIQIVYGGYLNEPKELDIFLNGSSFRDGTQNLLLTKDNRYRFLLQTKDQTLDLFNFIRKRPRNQTEVKIIKSYRMRLPV